MKIYLLFSKILHAKINSKKASWQFWNETDSREDLQAERISGWGWGDFVKILTTQNFWETSFANTTTKHLLRRNLWDVLPGTMKHLNQSQQQWHASQTRQWQKISFGTLGGWFQQDWEDLTIIDLPEKKTWEPFSSFLGSGAPFHHQKQVVVCSVPIEIQTKHRAQWKKLIGLFKKMTPSTETAPTGAVLRKEKPCFCLFFYRANVETVFTLLERLKGNIHLKSKILISLPKRQE